MKIEVTNFWLQNEENRILAKVRFSDDINSPYNGATAEVFIPMTGTIDELNHYALKVHSGLVFCLQAQPDAILREI